LSPYRGNDGTAEWAEHITAAEPKIEDQLVENFSPDRVDWEIFLSKLSEEDPEARKSSEKRRTEMA